MPEPTDFSRGRCSICACWISAQRYSTARTSIGASLPCWGTVAGLLGNDEPGDFPVWIRTDPGMEQRLCCQGCSGHSAVRRQCLLHANPSGPACLSIRLSRRLSLVATLLSHLQGPLPRDGVIVGLNATCHTEDNGEWRLSADEAGVCGGRETQSRPRRRANRLRFRPARTAPARHPPQCPGNGRCSPVCNGRGGVGRPGGFRSACRAQQHLSHDAMTAHGVNRLARQRTDLPHQS